MVLMTWLYITGLVFIVGGEINAILEHASTDGKARGARAAGEAAPPPLERPSVAAPGATKTAGAAVRSQERIDRARGGEPATAERPGLDDRGHTLH
jgi:membrane protein